MERMKGHYGPLILATVGQPRRIGEHVKEVFSESCTPQWDRTPQRGWTPSP